MENELKIIIDKAFIYESCPQKRMHADYRKEKLTQRLISYIDKKLSESTGIQIGDGLGTTSAGREQVCSM